MKPQRWWLALLAVALQAAVVRSAPAQDYVTSTWVYLRRPEPRMVLACGRSIAVIRCSPGRCSRSPDGLPVRTMDGTAGWVGATYVRSLATPTANDGPSLITLPGGAAFTRIDSTWSKPAIQTSTIRVQGGALRCGPTGDAADDDGTNLNKNRADVPGSSHPLP